MTYDVYILLSFAVVLLSIIICSILVIILSKNPLKIGYLKNVLGHEEEEENNLEEETSENDSPVKIINKTENSSESNPSSNE